MTDKAPKLTKKQKEAFDQCTPLQQKFVINIVRGDMPQVEAYRQAGGRGKTYEALASAACRAFKLVKVKAFYDSMMEKEATEAIMSREEALKILTDIGRARITDIAEFRTVQTGEDEEGNPVMQSVWRLKDGDIISEESARAIEEVTATPQGLKLKTHSAPQAIKQLAAMQGWDSATKHEHTGADGGPIETKTDDIDLARKLAFILAKAQKRMGE